MNHNITHIGHENNSRTFSSVLKDTGSTPVNLIKTGNGQLILSGNNLYSGDTIILSGSLKTGVSTALPSSTNVFVKGPFATLSVGTFQQTVQTISGNGFVFLSTGGELSISGNNDFLFSGNTSGAGSLIKNQQNTITLTRDNYATGLLTINAGTVILSAGVLNHSLVCLNNNSILRCISGYGLIGEYGPHINGLSDFTTLYNFNNKFNYNDSAFLYFGTSNPNGCFDYAYTGINFPIGYNLSQTHEDRWVGQFIVNTAGNHTFYTSSDDGSMIWIDGTLVVYNNFAQAPTEKSGTISLTTGLHEIVIAYFNSSGGEGLWASYSTPTSAKGLLPLNALRCGPAIFSISGSDNTLIDIDQCPYFTVSQKLNTSFTGTITGRGSFLKTGRGELLLTGNNTFTGNTIVAGGTLSPSPFNEANVNGPLGNNGLLRMWSGTVKYGGPTAVTYRNVETQGVSIFNITGANVTLTLAGNLSGSGDICKAGPASTTLIISGSNNKYVGGGTTVYGGSILQGYQNAIGTTSILSLANVASTYFYLNGWDTYVGALSGGGATGGVVSIGNNNLYIGTKTSPTNTTWSGKISGVGNVIKVGNSIQTFNTQAQPFTTNFTVSGGIFIMGYQNAGTGTLSSPVINVMPGAMIRSSVVNAFGYSGTAWTKTLNLNYGIWDVSAPNLGDADFFTTINMTGGSISLNSGNNFVMANGSAINTYPATASSTISGAGIITNRQAVLPLTVARGTATYDLIINLSGGCQMPIVKDGNGILYMSSSATPGSASPNSISRSFTVSGGTIILAGPDASTGTSFISNGAICRLLNNTVTVSAATYVVSAGALHGNGIISGAAIITNNIGAIIYGGTGSGNAGIMNVRALTFNGPNSTLQVFTNGTNAISRINTGTICSLSGNRIDISGALNVGTYTCISSIGGTITGALPILNANGSGRTITISLTANNLNLIAT